MKIGCFGLSAVLAVTCAQAPAQAAGCNGVINPFVWGCAPWDNNNGPKFPYYSKKVVTMRAPAGSKIETKNGVSMIDINGVKYPLSGVIAPGGGNVIAPGGMNVIAPGGANVQVITPN